MNVITDDILFCTLWTFWAIFTVKIGLWTMSLHLDLKTRCRYLVYNICCPESWVILNKCGFTKWTQMNNANFPLFIFWHLTKFYYLKHDNINIPPKSASNLCVNYKPSWRLMCAIDNAIELDLILSGLSKDSFFFF